MSAPARPLIDRRRTSSRDRGVLHHHPSSRNSSPRHSPAPSPVGSPTHQPGSHFPLRSALKHNHVHPEPRAIDCAEVEADPEARCEPPPMVQMQGTGEGSSLPASGLGPQNSSNGTLGPQYSRRVGFDTFESGADLEEKGASTGGGTGVNYSFTISAKSSCFIRTRASRTYLVATDLNEYSVHALNWVLDSITEDHDEIVVLRVIDPGSSAHSVWKAGARGMEEAREEAEGVLEQVMQKNGEEKQISIIVEFAIGPVEETIHRMIEIYRPDSLIVGTRGKTESVFKLGKGAYMGSISKWSVARSPVPVIVVRPSDKVREALEHRRQDPKKRSYVSLLGSASDSATNSTTMLGHNQGSALERTTTAPELERAGRGLGKSESAKEESAGKGSRSKWFGGGSEKKEKKGKEMKKFDTIS